MLFILKLCRSAANKFVHVCHCYFRKFQLLTHMQFFGLLKSDNKDNTDTDKKDVLATLNLLHRKIVSSLLFLGQLKQKRNPFQTMSLIKFVKVYWLLGALVGISFVFLFFLIHALPNCIAQCIAFSVASNQCL